MYVTVLDAQKYYLEPSFQIPFTTSLPYFIFQAKQGKPKVIYLLGKMYRDVILKTIIAIQNAKTIK